MSEPIKIICNYKKMEEWEEGIRRINRKLDGLIQKADDCQKILQETYEGEAFVEMDTFFSALKEHLYRLCVLYDKEAQFIARTSKTFSESDAKLAENAGEK